ncbi:MAG: PQQ-binding-like beta-propeller repeat protein [Verrucomicrobiaceae bacterium]|nr:PQQ-binding-like beta-propeller repeat protein [Verrucomicrobiaceae bacterium]
MTNKFSLINLSILLCLVVPAKAGDWPQFLGVYRNGSTHDESLRPEFTGNEPEIVWKHKLGSGFSGPVVSEGNVFIFHRQDNRAVLEALSTKNGEVKWTFSYISTYRDDFGFDNGPRSVPLVHEKKIYLLGAEGIAHCIDSFTGECIWSVDLQEKLGSTKGFFGRASSPIIIENTLILQIGGKGAGIVGLEPKTGNLKWKATDHEAGYASPVAADISGQKIAVCFTRNGLVCLDPATGNVIIDQPHRSSMHASVNAASPIITSPGKVFISACYGVGATLWKISPQKKTLNTLWKTNQKLDCHYATPINFEGHLIGFHGRQETGTELRCIDLLTGEVKWQSGRMAAGSITLAGKTLVILTERGELILAEANKGAFKPAARGQILGTDTRAMPALSNGQLFARDKRQLVCVKLNP